MANFDELINRVQDSGRKEQLRQIYAAEGDFRQEFDSYGLRQDEFSRKMNELGSLQKSFEDLKKQADAYKTANDSWKEFQDNYWDTEHNTSKAHVSDMAEMGRLKERITELEAMELGEGEMTTEQLKQEFERMAKSSGFVTREQLKEHPDRTSVANVLEKGFQSQGDAMREVYFSVEEMAAKHQQEFGTPLDRRKFFGAWQAMPAGTPVKSAYDQFTVEERETAAKAKNEQQEREIQERIQREVDEKVKKLQLDVSIGSGGRIPVDIAPQMGPVESRLHAERNSTAGKPVENPLGRSRPVRWDNIARTAATEYVNQSAGGKP